MGVNAQTMFIVADRLSQRRNEWKPFHVGRYFGWPALCHQATVTQVTGFEVGLCQHGQNSHWARTSGPDPIQAESMAETVKAEDLPKLAGKELPPSEWMEITQERVDQFAEATNDFQFIHVDPEKAAQTPFGGPVAHGFLSLSLLSYLNAQTAIVPENLVMGINYGSDKVRYLMPVRVGKRIRSRQTVLEVTEKKPGQWLMKTAVTVEIEGEETPALVAEILSMLVVA
jgi:acyl dehydratase